MRIMLAAPSFLPTRRANTMQVMKMSQALARLGHDLHLVVPHPGGSRMVNLPANEGGVVVLHEKNGERSSLVTWDVLSAHYGVNSRFPVYWLPRRGALRGYDFAVQSLQLARKLGADVIYTRVPQLAVMSSWLGGAAGTILEIHDYPQGSGGWLLKAFLASRTRGKRIIVITQALLDALKTGYKLPTEPPLTLIEPDGVDLERFQKLPEPAAARKMIWEERGNVPVWEIGADRFVAGYTGHLYPGRGREMLLGLAKRLPAMVFLVVGGEPEDVRALKTQAKMEGLDNILLAGFVPNAQLPFYQAACDVLLMPYQRQVAASSGGDIGRYFSPMKLFEYMAAGRAILSSDLPVLREVLSDENSLLLPPGDLDAWEAGLLGLRDDSAKRAALAANSLRDAQNFGWEARAARILAGMPI